LTNVTNPSHNRSARLIDSWLLQTKNLKISHVTQFRNFGTPVITGQTSKVNDMFINKNKTANV